MKTNVCKGAIIIEGHVQGLSNVRSLGEHGIPVIVIDTGPCIAQYSKYCKSYFRCPQYESSEFIEFLISLGKQKNLAGWVLIPSNDHIVENISNNLDRVHNIYKTIIPDKQTLNNIINKANLIKLAMECGSHVPATCYPDSIQKLEDLRFPILLKGIKGLTFYKANHAKAIQIDSKQELFDTLKNMVKDNVMIQELIPFDSSHHTISFTCFAIKGVIKSYWMGQKLREHPLKYGTATFSQSMYNQDILLEATPLIASLNYSGICEIEYMYDNRDNQYKLIEINPRTWLWVGLAKECGINYALIIYNYLNELPIKYPHDYLIGVKWINLIIDIIYSLKGIISGTYRIIDILRSYKGKKVHAIWNWNDIMPELAFILLLPYIFTHRK